ncbi:MAG: PorT family protein [Bacteroidetes bacterium]|nr:PorT family protein [Bacteroidota bacterium]
MKKLIILIIVLVVTTLTNNIYAQKKPKSNFQLGVKISPNISWLNSNSQDMKSDGTLPKFSWGFIADFQFAEKYFFSTGFNINSTGGKIIHTDSISALGSGSLHRSINVRYVEFPFSIKMKTRQFGYLTYFGQIGLGLGMRLSANSDDDFYPKNSSTATSNNDIKIEDQINFFRLSMILAAGVEYNLGGSTSLFGALTFNNGFSNIFDYPKDRNPIIDADASSNSFEITLGLLF